MHLLLDAYMYKMFRSRLIITQYTTYYYSVIKINSVSPYLKWSYNKKVLSEGAIGYITKFILNKESAIYLGTYGNQIILFEAVEAALEWKEYINSLLFNHNGSIKKSISTKGIINKKLFLFNLSWIWYKKQDQKLYTIALLMAL